MTTKKFVTKGLRLYRWFDQLIVATTKRDVQSMLMERGLTVSTFRRFPVEEMKSAELQEYDDSGNPKPVMRTAQEIIESTGRGIIPEGE